MDVQELLAADPSRGRLLLAARMGLSKYCGGAECPTYLAGLELALASEPPPFDTSGYADLYREASADPRWMAVSLITNAQREGEGATRLWSLAACSDDASICEQLKRHAIDESKHALLYLALLDLVFPGVVAPDFSRELRAVSPRYSQKRSVVALDGSPYARRATIDDFVQMNIAELRTTIHHLMQRQALVMHCPRGNLRRATSVQDVLLGDELRHVSYTAVLIERLANHNGRRDLDRLFIERLGDFNRITTNELGIEVH